MGGIPFSVVLNEFPCGADNDQMSRISDVQL